MKSAFAGREEGLDAHRRINMDPRNCRHADVMPSGKDVHSNCTTSADTVNFKLGDREVKVTTTGAVTATVIQDLVGPTDLLVTPPGSTI